MINITILASGTGTNALKLLEYSKRLKNIKIIGMIVDQADSKLLVEQLTVPVILIERKKGEKKSEHENKILNHLKEWNTQWILLAGFMRILSNDFISHYPNKIVNIHPSLLPAFPGLHAYEEAFKANVLESGITIHFVDAGIDTGAIWRQEKFTRLPDDSLETFIQRGKEVEWKLYPQFLKWLSTQVVE